MESVFILISVTSNIVRFKLLQKPNSDIELLRKNTFLTLSGPLKRSKCPRAVSGWRENYSGVSQGTKLFIDQRDGPDIVNRTKSILQDSAKGKNRGLARLQFSTGNAQINREQKRLDIYKIPAVRASKRFANSIQH